MLAFSSQSYLTYIGADVLADFIGSSGKVWDGKNEGSDAERRRSHAHVNRLVAETWAKVTFDAYVFWAIVCFLCYLSVVTSLVIFFVSSNICWLSLLLLVSF